MAAAGNGGTAGNGGSYRDNLEAAHARADSLESQLAEAQARADGLESQLADAFATPEKPAAHPKRSAAKRTITFHKGAQYFPFYALWLSGMRQASNAVPWPKKKRTGVVVMALLRQFIGVPLLYLLAVLHMIHMYLLVAPWTLFLTTLLSVPTVFIVFIGNFRYSDAPRSRFLKNVNGPDYLWALLSFAGQPLLPLFAAIWSRMK